jgi:hypothetical protein
VLTQVQGVPDLQTPALMNKTPWTCIFHKKSGPRAIWCLQTNMTNYSTSLQQLVTVTWQPLCRNRPSHNQVQQHVQNPISWSQLLYRNLCRQTLHCCSGYPWEI